VVRGHEQMADDYRYGAQSRWVCFLRIPGYRSDLAGNRPRSGILSNVVTESIKLLEPYCCEFLIHAADNEGLQQGIDHELVEKLAQWCRIPVTYAGGGRNLQDLDLVEKLSGGKVDLTIGSALDVFGGTGVKFDDCVAWNNRRAGNA